MRLKFFIAALCLQSWCSLKAQDTFSILAFDSITGEVGGAGASCLDLYLTSFNNHFIIDLFPGEGAVASQASYIQANQLNARSRFFAGDSPQQIISWMTANDIAATPDVRQYGVVRMNTGFPRSAAYTGTNCLTYKNHITGPNYSIQGNILLGQFVLDSMEARFKREEGDLACKLMAALQGAKMVGADSRCTGNNSSSLFAFLKVAQPTDTFGTATFPSFLVSLRTSSGDSIEPIDSLQVLFNSQHSCNFNPVGVSERLRNAPLDLKIYPNPALQQLAIKCQEGAGLRLLITNALGIPVFENKFAGELLINVENWQPGVYLVELGGKRKKIVLAGR